MDDLVQFVRDRLDEDAVLAASGESWTAFDESTQGTRRVDVDYSFERVVACTRSWRAEHIARHDPARVLADVEAKRQQLDSLLSEKHAVVEDCWYTCAAATEERDGGETCRDDIRGEPCECGRDYRLARGTRLLALPYADHPAYREEWRL